MRCLPWAVGKSSRAPLPHSHGRPFQAPAHLVHNPHAPSPRLTVALSQANYALTGLFCLELVLKVAGLGLWGYFSDYWNQFDALVVAFRWAWRCCRGDHACAADAEPRSPARGRASLSPEHSKPPGISRPSTYAPPAYLIAAASWSWASSTAVARQRLGAGGGRAAAPLPGRSWSAA